ncbi:hypothetical protein NM688_g8397 [Phlebia brevispora]|uniref:Uncharacterized protein n=1 Tax=Phlebia brevispora TaxID=194682 RepID=A0ACC1RU50_9APHY|nr:hypothetical protein NM688_g8397 [Phlebia brevispora]
MLWLFGSDLSLYVLSLLEFKDVFTLYLLSRATNRFLVEHEGGIFHQLALLHRFIPIGVTLEDIANAEVDRGGWLNGVQTWKELCRRCVLMERNWSGKGSVLEGAYMTFEGDVRLFEIDETERTIIAIVEKDFQRSLVVKAMEDGRELWSRPANGIFRAKFSQGCLLLARDTFTDFAGIEIWLHTPVRPVSVRAH